MTMEQSLSIIVCLIFSSVSLTNEAFVDTGDPYKDGPLHVGQLTITKSMQNSPVHTIAFFPLEKNTYPVVVFIGGFNSLVPTELYQTVLSKLAAHGFFVFGLDFFFPAFSSGVKKRFGHMDFSTDYVAKVVQQMNWLQTYMKNQTTSIIQWENVGLLCHSAGCDTTLLMVLANQTSYKSTIFLEPASFHATKSVPFRFPALMYGTQLSEEGVIKCAMKGADWLQFYTIWQCPRILMEVANFGHCDILDPAGWDACHLAHFCKTTNNTHLETYRQFVHGVCASFFISSLQGRAQALDYITDPAHIYLPLKDHRVDIKC